MNTEWSDFAWAVGLFEGEGWIGGRAPTFYPKLAVISTDEDTVIRFAAIIGFGAVSGPKAGPTSRHKPSWRWQAHGDDVLGLLREMAPHLSTRRRGRAEEVLYGRPAFLAEKMSKICPECNAAFTLPRWTNYARQKYCSPRCQYTWQLRESKDKRRVYRATYRAKKRAEKKAQAT